MIWGDLSSHSPSYYSEGLLLLNRFQGWIQDLKWWQLLPARLDTPNFKEHFWLVTRLGNWPFTERPCWLNWISKANYTKTKCLYQRCSLTSPHRSMSPWRAHLSTQCFLWQHLWGPPMVRSGTMLWAGWKAQLNSWAASHPFHTMHTWRFFFDLWI